MRICNIKPPFKIWFRNLLNLVCWLLFINLLHETIQVLNCTSNVLTFLKCFNIEICLHQWKHILKGGLMLQVLNNLLNSVKSTVDCRSALPCWRTWACQSALTTVALIQKRLTLWNMGRFRLYRYIFVTCPCLCYIRRKSFFGVMLGISRKL